MGSHNALYFRGELPANYRPKVEGPCSVRRLGVWTELSLPGVDDGEASAAELSRLISGEVLWTIVQTTASAVAVVHFESGKVRRRIEFADGSWYRVEGKPEPWEVKLFSDEELEAAKEVVDPEEDAELEAVFARKTLETDQALPWLREWETVYSALGVTREEFDAARTAAPLLIVRGSRRSKSTLIARGALVFALATFVAFARTKDGGFAGLGAAFLLVAFAAGYVRRMTALPIEGR